MQSAVCVFGNPICYVLCFSSCVLFSSVSVSILPSSEMDALSSLMEVKLDIREKRTEWLPLRVSVIIKIESYLFIVFCSTK